MLCIAYIPEHSQWKLFDPKTNKAIAISFKDPDVPEDWQFLKPLHPAKITKLQARIVEAYEALRDLQWSTQV